MAVGAARTLALALAAASALSLMPLAAGQALCAQPDPFTCGKQGSVGGDAEACSNAIAGAVIRQVCPGLCGSCVAVTATSTSTSTTTEADCPDPEPRFCGKLGDFKADPKYVGARE